MYITKFSIGGGRGSLPIMSSPMNPFTLVQNTKISTIIVNTDDRCDPILDGRITDMARTAVTRNNASSFLVYDCQVDGANWNSTVISQIRAALNGTQPPIPR